MQTASDILQRQGEQLTAQPSALRETGRSLRGEIKESGFTERRKQAADVTLAETVEMLREAGYARAAHCPALKTMPGEVLAERQIKVDSYDNREREMHDWLLADVDAEATKLRR